ncbi:HNH endonuclease [Streptomyces sp. NPDC056938]|uniref:HNH endonuclease n=1 Tax=unclassified Streptomyces TaxID=2593676 RepID=UPI00362C2CF8
MDETSLLLAVRQQGLCPLCKQALIVGAEYEPDSPREWINWFVASKKMLHKHYFTYRRDGGTDERNNLRLVHSECRRQHGGEVERVQVADRTFLSKSTAVETATRAVPHLCHFTAAIAD